MFRSLALLLLALFVSIPDTFGQVFFDNGGAQFSTVGSWPTSQAVSGYYGSNFQVRQGTSASELIIDNDQGSAPPTWTTHTNGSGYHGTNYRQRGWGSTGDAFTWTPNLSQAGIYLVYAKWVADSVRTKKAVYTVNHANGSANITVNQEVNGGQWNLLGVFSLNAGTGNTVVLTQPTDSTAVADAIRIVGPVNAATWTPNVPAGQYDVYARWTAHTDRASNAKYVVAQSTGPAEVTVNQKNNGGQWNLLGIFNLTSASTITLPDDADGYVVADAIQLIPRTVLPVEDAHVEEGAPTANFGADPALRMFRRADYPSGDKKLAYLKFNASTITSGIANAKVRIFSYTFPALWYGAYPVTDITWGENTITWNNRPSLPVCPAAELLGRDVGLDRGWNEWDVTQYVREKLAAGETSISLAFHMGDVDWGAESQQRTLWSREHAEHWNRPELSVTYGTPPSPPSGIAIGAIQDTNVRSSSPAATGGTNKSLIVQERTAGSYWTYLTFNTSSFASTVGSTKLRLFGARAKLPNGTDDAVMAVYSVQDTSWTESALNWNNKPAVGSTPLSTITVSDGNGEYREWDVSAYVAAERAAGRSTVSFAIQQTAAAENVTRFHSRNSDCFQPELRLTPTAPTINFVHTDQLNTPRLITNSVAQAVWKWENTDPFGNNAPNENPSSLGNFTNNLRFPGQYFDQETNLHYNMARDYDSAIGRYIQSDPIGLEGGINTFAYVGGNPLSFTDPEGLTPAVGCMLGLPFGGPIGCSAGALLGTLGTVAGILAVASLPGDTPSDDTQRQAEYDAYKRRSLEPPPPNLDECERLRWQLRREQDVVRGMQAWDAKWQPGRHAIAIAQRSRAIEKLKKQLEQKCGGCY